MPQRLPIFSCLFFLLVSSWVEASALAEKRDKSAETIDGVSKQEQELWEGFEALKEFGEESRFSFDNEFKVEWHNNHEFSARELQTDDFIKIADELKADWRYRALRIGMRFELLYYPDHLIAKRETPAGVWENQISKQDERFERYYLVYETKRFRLDVGDCYATFGRGLALSLRRETGGVVDTSLKGVKIELHSDMSSLVFLGGFTNTLNRDPDHEQPQEDPQDFIGAFRGEQRFGDYANAAAHVVLAEFGRLESTKRRRFIPQKQTLIYGGNLEAPDLGGFGQFYAEGNYMQRHLNALSQNGQKIERKSESGYALYSALNLFFGAFVMSLEYKWYKDFYFARSWQGARELAPALLDNGETLPDGLTFNEDIYYNAVPTLERTDIETNRDFINDHGGRVRLDYNIGQTRTQPYAAFYFDINGHSEQGDERIWHAYGGLTQHFGRSEMFLDGGYRDETSMEAGKGRILTLAHAKAGGDISLHPKHLLNIEAAFQNKENELLEQTERYLDTTLGYTFVGWFSISFFATMQNIDYASVETDDDFSWFFAGEIATRFSDHVQLSIFGGQVRESYRCYGGFCRKVPPFEGVKGKFILRY